MNYLIFRLMLAALFGVLLSTPLFSRANSLFLGTPVLNQSFSTSSDEYRVGKRFGRSVAIDGNTAAVGDPVDSDRGGAVYVFVRFNGIWTQQAKLTPEDDYHSQSEFGQSVAVKGNVIVVGSSGNGSGLEVRRGAVYVFERNGTTWSQQQKLTATDWSARDAFGTALSLCGDTMVIGAPGDDDGGADSGSAYVFRDLGSWIEEAKLIDLNAAAADDFGGSVACENDTAIVGASGDDNIVSAEGSVFVFTRTSSTWSQQAKLFEHAASQDDRFGRDVSLSGNTLIAGTYDSAHVYVRSGTSWTRQIILLPTNGEPHIGFGWSVAIEGNEAVIGAPRDDTGEFDSGSAYAFKRIGTNWSHVRKISANPRKEFYGFGKSVAISGTSAIIGSPHFGSIADFGGEAHVFVNSGTWQEQGELKPNDGAENDNFGSNVAISGDIAVVSAQGDERVGGVLNLGSVYVLYRIGPAWYPLKQLWPGSHPSSLNDIKFGNSVDIDGDRIVGGAADLEITSQGAAYVYSATIGTSAAPRELRATNLSLGSKFGTSVAISGTTAVVGAPGNEHDSVTSGAAFVFVESGSSWVLEAKLTPNDGQNADFFGHSVAIDGEKIVVGAHKDDDNGVNSGSAYVYTRSNSIWTQQAKLTSSDGAALDEFGYDVAIDGTYIVVGASGDDDDGFNSGSAYVFTGAGPNWTQQAKLKANDPGSLDAFARDVDIDGDLIVLSASVDDDNGTNSGSAYVFKRVNSNWLEYRKLLAAGGAAQDQFGRGVAVDGANVIAGAPFRDIGSSFADRPTSGKISNLVGDFQGAAYFFEIPDEPIVSGGTRFDFDGDAKADISIFRPSVAEWWYLKSSDGGNYATQFGATSDVLVPADFTGDGRTDIAFFRPSTAEWFVLRSEDESFFSFPFGANGDIPVPGDFDGDGIDDPAVFRPSTATWFILRSSDAQVGFVGFGADGDKPTIGDFDGDGTDDIAVYRPSSSEWWQFRSTDGVFATQFGSSGDKTVVADYTGDGADDIAFWRPSNGNWFVLRSEDNSFFSFPFGATGDVPAPADYDGDGTADPTVFRPAQATWYSLQSTAGTVVTGFGANGDEPVPSAYVVE